MELIRKLSKDKKTRRKLEMVMVIMLLLQAGYVIPVPFINRGYLDAVLGGFSTSGAGGLLNALTGNSFSTMSIFALNITPYITASIVVQLLMVAVPALGDLRNDGAVGQKKMDYITYGCSAGLAFLEAIAMAVGFGTKGLYTEFTWYAVVLSVVIWTAASVAMMFLGKFITDKLIGDGISIILLFNILSSLPGDASTIAEVFGGGNFIRNLAVGAAILLILFIIMAYLVILNDAEKHIKVVNSSKVSASGPYVSQLPIKLNLGGVMPVIFSGSIMALPTVINQIVGAESGTFLYEFARYCNTSDWFTPSDMKYTVGVIPYIILTFFFAYFYATITFNVREVSDNLRKNGNAIPGIRPGEPTEKYLKNETVWLILLGTAMLIVAALIPTILSGICNLKSISCGGTTLIIVVGVMLDTARTAGAQASAGSFRKFLF